MTNLVFFKTKILSIGLAPKSIEQKDLDAEAKYQKEISVEMIWRRRSKASANSNLTKSAWKKEKRNQISAILQHLLSTETIREIINWKLQINHN